MENRRPSPKSILLSLSADPCIRTHFTTSPSKGPRDKTEISDETVSPCEESPSAADVPQQATLVLGVEGIRFPRKQ